MHQVQRSTVILDMICIWGSHGGDENWCSRGAGHFTRGPSWLAWAGDDAPGLAVAHVQGVPVVLPSGVLNGLKVTLHVNNELAVERPIAANMLAAVYPRELEGTIPLFFRSWMAECCWFRVMACLKYLSW